MASFVLSFFLLDVLDEIRDLIESVSEGFLTYSYFMQCLASMSAYTGTVACLPEPKKVALLDMAYTLK